MASVGAATDQATTGRPARRRRGVSEADAREARALDERLIKRVDEETALVAQRIAGVEARLKAGLASLDDAKLLRGQREPESERPEMNVVTIGDNLHRQCGHSVPHAP